MREMSRNQLASHLCGNKLSVLCEAFGYDMEPTFDDYLRAFKKIGIARRIISAIIDYTWRTLPEIKDKEKENSAESEIPKKTTPTRRLFQTQINQIIPRKQQSLKSVISPPNLMAESIKTLDKNLRFFDLAKRADLLACIGQYSIVVIGTGGKPETPLEKGAAISDIAFLSVYSEGQAEIDSWNVNPTSNRYGMPETYKIKVNGEKNVFLSHIVHHSRIIHISHDCIDNDIFGTPKLECAYNYIQDLLKVVGASSEMFWLGAYQGLVFNLDRELSANDNALEAMEQSLKDYDSKLNRKIKTYGVDVQQLSPSVADPSANVDMLLQLISAASGIPTRILLGSEQGQLASTTDRDMFLSMIAGRRQTEAESSILRPLLNRLMEYGYIPKEEYEIEWKPLIDTTPNEKIDIANKTITGLRAATGQMGEITDFITKEEIRELFGLSKEMPETDFEPAGDYSEIIGELPEISEYEQNYLSMKSKRERLR